MQSSLDLECHNIVIIDHNRYSNSKSFYVSQIDAIFVIDHHLTDDSRIEKISSASYSCSSTGDGMMTRKDNDFNSHWNRGFQQLQASGQFSKLCEEAKKKHGKLQVHHTTL